jgi:hypothetical protein
MVLAESSAGGSLFTYNTSENVFLVDGSRQSSPGQLPRHDDREKVAWRRASRCKVEGKCFRNKLGGSFDDDTLPQRLAKEFPLLEVRVAKAAWPRLARLVDTT